MPRLPWLIRTRFASLGNSSESSIKQIVGDILGKFSYFYHDNVCCVYLLALPHRDHSNEYTEHSNIL